MGNCTSADAVGTGPIRGQYWPTSYRVNDQPPPLMPVQHQRKKRPALLHLLWSILQTKLWDRPRKSCTDLSLLFTVGQRCCDGHCVMVKYPGGKCQSNCIDCYGGAGGLTPSTIEGRSVVYGAPVCTQ